MIKDEASNKRPRSEKDTVPEFTDGEDALDWMEKKLNGSWTDALDEPRESGAVVDVATASDADMDTAFKAMMGL